MAEYSVKAVCQLVGIHPSTLRAWERRYVALNPKRSGSGRRQYGQEDLERLQLLVQLVQAGHAIGNVATLDTLQLKELVVESRDIAASSAPPIEEQEPLPVVQTLLNHIRQLEFDDVHQTLCHARLLHDARTFVLRIVSPLMTAIGNLVFRNQLSIFHEHALSAILKVHLGELHTSLGSAHRSQIGKQEYRPICLAAREGDHHEFGILIAAVLCCVHRHPFFYLGPNMPAAPLCEAARALGAKVVLLGSVQLPPGTPAPLQEEYIRDLDNFLGPEAEIWWGGYLTQPAAQLKTLHPFRHIASLVDLDHILAGEKVPDPNF